MNDQSTDFDKDDIEKGRIKFFDPNKGFGFVVIERTDEEIYLHKSVLEKQGKSTIAPGTTVSVLVNDEKDDDVRIEAVVDMDDSTATGPAMMLRIEPAVREQPKQILGTGVAAKWLDKGFGFVQMDNGDNVFVHAKALQEGAVLVPGMQYVVSYLRVPKGFQAESIWQRV